MAKLIAAALSAALLVFAATAHAQSEERTAMPTKGLLWGSKMTIETGPCCTQAGHRAQRDGAILRLRLQNNRTLKITDCADQDACEADRFRRHWLAAWWPAQGYYVVNVGLYEEGLAYLVSEKDGRTTRVAAVPVLSPSGRRAVALVSNLMSGVDLEIIDFSVSPPRLTTVSEMPACAGSGPNSFLRPKPVWVDETHVRFEGKSPQPGDDPNTKQLLRLVDGKPQWQC